MTDGRFYDLRHTWASDYIMRGGNLFALCHLGGWTGLQMVQDVYGHLAPDFMAKSVDCMAGLLAGTQSDTPHGVSDTAKNAEYSQSPAPSG